MHDALLAIGLRHVERLLIVGGGILAIWLGYRMFLAMPNAEEKSEGKIQLPGGVSIYVSRVGPGVFFALFGAVLMAVAMQQSIQVAWREAAPAATPTVAASPAPAAAATAATGPTAPHAAEPAGGRSLSYSGISPKLPGAGSSSALEQAQAADTLRQLALLADWLETTGRAPLSRERQVDAAAALRDARLRLIASVWDESAWGSFVDFRLWLETEVDPPPAPLATAVNVYRGVR